MTVPETWWQAPGVAGAGHVLLRRCVSAGWAAHASSKATYLCGLSGSAVVSVMTYAQDVCEPAPAVVGTAMCGGFFGFSLLLKPSNSFT